MKQILQSYNTGLTEMAESPCPQVKAGHILIRSAASLVSIGTERMIVEFAKANLIDKAKQQPDKVKVVLEKVKTDGIISTMEAIRSNLDRTIALGYCNAGVVMEAGKDVGGFVRGDRVISNGPHAEVVCVPKNLCAKIPDAISFESAAFTVLGSIGLQGVRLIQPTLGENIVVTGLGLVGLLTVQILKAHGCKVLGIDMDPGKLAIAKSFGVQTVDLANGEDPIAKALAFSQNRGVDGVIITAATQSNEPVHQAAQMCRKRGRIVLVGVTGLELSRADFYEKELSFQVSCSYGPGRYDQLYEAGGMDYPIGFVRWTEQRNFEAVLEMLVDGRLNVKPLITHRFEFEKALEAYELIHKSKLPLGIILQYPTTENVNDDRIFAKTINLPQTAKPSNINKNNKPQKPVMAMIGAGEFASRTLLPAIKNRELDLKTIASSGGLNAAYQGRKFGFKFATTDVDSIFTDRETNTIFVATRHDSHAAYVCKALEAGKHVFVEKPLAINPEQLEMIKLTYNKALNSQRAPLLMVGFNRRFAPQIQKVKRLLNGLTQPKSLIMTINAGAIPASHWTQHPDTGGGRVIGEACHFIDLFRFLIGYPITGVQVTTFGGDSNASKDTLSFTLSFADGSFGMVHYFANGHKSLPKERLEIYGGGRVLQLNNFKELRGFGWPGFQKMSMLRQDKGHINEIRAFCDAIQNGAPSPIPFEELVEVTEVSFKIAGIIK